MIIIFIFLYVTLVYRISIMTYVLVLSWYITHHMTYDDSTCLLCHNYYINVYIRHNFMLDVRCPLYRWSWILLILTPSRILLPCMTMSSYYCYLSVFLSFVPMLDSITTFMYLNSFTFTTHSLVEYGPIYRASMCFHPMIN